MLALVGHKRWAYMLLDPGFGPVNTTELRARSGRCWGPHRPGRGPQGASLPLGKGRGARETGAGMAGCIGGGRGMENTEFKLGLSN